MQPLVQVSLISIWHHRSQSGAPGTNARAAGRICGRPEHAAAGVLLQNEIPCIYPSISRLYVGCVSFGTWRCSVDNEGRILLLKTMAFKRCDYLRVFNRQCLTGPDNSVECAVLDSGVVSSAGRASALQAEGRRFDPVTTHHL
jgi:hypothetical protein